MSTATLPPMAPGGKWLLISGQSEPTYVVHEAHIQRHMLEGAQVVADPRKPEDFVKPEPAPSANETAMQAKIEQLEAMLKQLMTQKAEPVKK